MQIKLVSLLSIIVLVICQSCTTEYKLAREFVETRSNVSVYFLTGGSVSKSDLRKDVPDSIMISKTARDSTMVPNICLTCELSDSIFLEAYYNSLLGAIYEMGISLYTEQLTDSFLFTIPAPAYLVNNAQLEAEEFDHIFRDSHEFGEFEFYQEITLKGMNINSWFEISELKSAGQDYKVLFDASGIHDEIFGFFTENIFSGEVNYHYRITPLDTEKFYDYVRKTGNKHAEYIFDYLMNVHIIQSLEDPVKPRFWFHYDRPSNTIWPVEKDKFQLMD